MVERWKKGLRRREFEASETGRACEGRFGPFDQVRGRRFRYFTLLYALTIPKQGPSFWASPRGGEEKNGNAITDGCHAVFPPITPVCWSQTVPYTRPQAHSFRGCRFPVTYPYRTADSSSVLASTQLQADLYTFFLSFLFYRGEVRGLHYYCSLYR